MWIVEKYEKESLETMFFRVNERTYVSIRNCIFPLNVGFILMLGRGQRQNTQSNLRLP